MVFTEKLLPKTGGHEPFTDILVLRGQIDRYRDVGIESHQRRIVQMLCVRMHAIEAVSPTANYNDVADPRSEGIYKLPKAVRILSAIHCCLPNNGPNARRRISSA
jgi:hypothetical protein